MSTTTLIAKSTTPLPKIWSLALAVTVLLVILFAPALAGLPIAGQRMLAVFGFAIVVWATEALDYAVSAVVIAGLMAVLLGISPDPAKPAALLGTTQGLTMAVSGFGNTALILVAAALFLAAAMSVTGLDRRIALVILSHVGTSAARIVIGGIAIAVALSFLVPSATARAAVVVPIMLGVVVAFGADKRSRFAALVMLTTVQAVSVWNVGVKTGPPRRTWLPSASSSACSATTSPGSTGSSPRHRSPSCCRSASTTSPWSCSRPKAAKCQVARRRCGEPSQTSGR